MVFSKDNAVTIHILVYIISCCFFSSSQLSWLVSVAFCALTPLVGKMKIKGRSKNIFDTISTLFTCKSKESTANNEKGGIFYKKKYHQLTSQILFSDWKAATGNPRCFVLIPPPSGLLFSTVNGPSYNCHIQHIPLYIFNCQIILLLLPAFCSQQSTAHHTIVIYNIFLFIY